MKVVEHEHPLTLIDLQVQYQQQEEDVEEDGEDEAGDGITKEVFHGVKCKRCCEEIHMYHRYLYKCMECEFALHKFCGELSNRLDHPLHPNHPLVYKQRKGPWDWMCPVCEQRHLARQMCYSCDECDFAIDLKCAVEGGKNIIYHPCHQHFLICSISKPILCRCNACGKRHEGVFYTCTTCTNFTIHTDCAFLPKTLLIQQTTDDAFHHTHPLTLSYSFPILDQRAKHDPKCRVCGAGFAETWYLWIYKCDACMYYAHLHCATSTSEPFMSIFLSPGLGKTTENYKDVDHPHLLHLPFPDETHSIPKHLLFFHTSDHQVKKVNPLTHASHTHPLTLVNCNDQTSSSSEVIDSSWLLLNKCHDPLKKTQFLCNACLRPITSTMPFYNCSESCDFALHEWCTRLPHQIENHPAHPQHPLLLTYPNTLPHLFFGVFLCKVCDIPCNGFAYCCVKCKYYVDVTCALLPKHITHESHPNHLLSLIVQPEYRKRCIMCLEIYSGYPLVFHCKSCDKTIHPRCALLLPKAIRHKYDKHPMHLSYLPIENHKSEYFCEICENDLNPHQSFYHCQECAQSVHAACAPLILQSETQTVSHYWSNIYYFVNIKFGDIHNNTDAHPHPLSFAQATVLDGQCSMCGYRLQGYMIFKCLEKCGFAIHYKCCKRLNKI